MTKKKTKAPKDEATELNERTCPDCLKVYWHKRAMLYHKKIVHSGMHKRARLVNHFKDIMKLQVLLSQFSLLAEFLILKLPKDTTFTLLNVTFGIIHELRNASGGGEPLC